MLLRNFLSLFVSEIPLPFCRGSHHLLLMVRQHNGSRLRVLQTLMNEVQVLVEGLVFLGLAGDTSLDELNLTDTVADFERGLHISIVEVLRVSNR